MTNLYRGLFICSVMTQSAIAGDWPQILGPTRNGVAVDEQLAEKWPAEGPKVLWRCKLGSGYAGAAVSGNRVVVFHRTGSSERIECLAADTGKSQWKADFPANYRGGIDPDIGPRCVPLIAGDAVYAFGAAGDLHAVDLAAGKPRWSRALYEDYGGDEGYFGAGSTPILLGGKLLINVGGRGAGLVALDPANGKTVWKASDEAASYSSPTKANVDGKEQAIFITRMNCVLADPQSGKTTVLFAFGKRGPTVNAAMPLVIDGKVFATATYGVGCVLAPIENKAVKPLWSRDDVLSSQYSTPVHHNGFLYGTHGREDVGVAELRCVEAATGRVRWKQADYGVTHIILAGNKLLIQRTDGRLALAVASPDKYQQLGMTGITTEPTRALPALSSGRLFVRTGSGGGELLCLHVEQP